MGENKKESKAKGLSIDLNTIHAKVYNKVALWHNEDCDDAEKGKRLKFVCHEVIQDVLDDVFDQIDVQTSTGIINGKVTKNKFWDKFKKEEGEN